MTCFRAGALLVLVVLTVITAVPPALAAEVSRYPNRCQVQASTGKSEAGRDPESRATCARVDNRLPDHVSIREEKKHERPIDRLRSRGEGRIQATGDKGAIRELREESRPRR